MVRPSAPRRLLGTLACGLALVACSDSGADATTAPPRPLLWHAAAPNGAEVWLHGTMHLGDPTLTALAPEAEAALEEAEALWTEVEVGLEATARLTEAGSYPPDDSLRAHLPPRVHRKLAAALEPWGLDWRALDRYRPWMVQILLGDLQAQRWRGSGPVLDEALRRRARELGKELGALETVDEQLAAISTDSEADQVHLLEVALDLLLEDRRTGRDRMGELVEAWRTGDAERLLQLQEEQLDRDDPAQLRWWQRLGPERNRRMAERILDRLAERPRKVYVAVGAYHLIGPDSVVDLLRRAGWTVERVPSRGP